MAIIDIAVNVVCALAVLFFWGVVIVMIKEFHDERKVKKNDRILHSKVSTSRSKYSDNN